MVAKDFEKLKNKNRSIVDPKGHTPEGLGPLEDLVGVWNNEELPGRGWNMIALPFHAPPKDKFPFNYRLLLNQYNEQLVFSTVDGPIPNRGIKPLPPQTPKANNDQFLMALSYEQNIKQIAAADFPDSGLAGPKNLDIHHEPGLFLRILNEETNELDICRLATIPHGDSVLAMGRSSEEKGKPTIPVTSGLPTGVNDDFERNPYLEPYKHFHNNLFEGLFDPTAPQALLDAANQGVDIIESTVLTFDSTLETGGIKNIPFVVRQANAASMKSTFWIQKVKDGDTIKLRLQYLQVVMLDFFGRRDGLPGLIGWPHVSINTMTKLTNVHSDRF
ncbi:heme-binding protein [Acanthopleuribacter pedis]|uniref:Uncharacterized protein n=1 Tax=Acanthopleuribacter pedis TaxID=442870 RepID=A0A8J7Q543_9BACT|nr:heme-binding protein [Acanthopleuribacter pedis]MBO1318061.1 hypothetical protein [Acanthopleuribacter pedis]